MVETKTVQQLAANISGTHTRWSLGTLFELQSKISYLWVRHY